MENLNYFDRRNLAKYIYFYKITNLVNGKFYYGIHSTNDLEDGYLGSGTRIKQAILKYGAKNFSKEILKFFDTWVEAEAYEAFVVTREMCTNPMCYNLQEGGRGGTRGAVFMQKGEVGTRVLPEVLEQYRADGWVPGGKSHRGEWNSKIVESRKRNDTPERQLERSNRAKRVWQTEGYWEHMSEVHKGNVPGNKDTVMVTDGTHTRFVRKEDLSNLEVGWYVGMAEAARAKRLGNHSHAKGSKVGAEGRKNMSESHKGKVWIVHRDGYAAQYSPEKAVELLKSDEYRKGRVWRES